MPTLHLLTIGQAPRPDITPEITGWIGDWPGLVVREAGALDGLSRAEIERAGRAGNADGGLPLVSRLRDGSEVVVPAGFVEPRLLRLAEAVPPGEVGAILCTGRFEGAPARIVPRIVPRIVRADAAFEEALALAAPRGAAVGVLVPHQRQLEDALSRVPAGRRALAAAWSPYGPAETRRASLLEVVERRFAGAGLIGLNCLGYTGADAQAVEAATGTPVTLARRALADAVRARLAEAANPRRAGVPDRRRAAALP